MGDCFAPLGPPLLPWDSMAQTHKQTHTQTDMATPRPTRPSGAELVKILDFSHAMVPNETNQRKKRLQISRPECQQQKNAKRAKNVSRLLHHTSGIQVLKGVAA